MSNSYYTHATYPTPNSPGSSAQLRAELQLITEGFDKLPTLAGNGYKVVMINAGGTALVASSALQGLAITGSTINSTAIGGTTPSTGAFTAVSASSGFTGNVTGNLTGNVTGNVTGNLTGNVTSSGSNAFASATISGGSINNTVIGNSTPQAITGTTVTATSGFTGNVTGNVTGNLTGNVTGNLTGNVTGNVTGDLSGNVTAGSGTSTFNNVTINGTLDMNAGTTGTITGLATPTNDSDAANKGYVDSVAQGLDPKASVRVATTANITLSGTQTIDGVAVVAGNRVLVKNQSTAANNGIYVVASGTWTRSADMDVWTEFPGAFVFVEEGTTNDNSGWVCTVSAGGTLGTTAVTWEQFSGAGQITAGAGMTKTGNTLNVGTASASRIVVNTDDIDLAATGVAGGTYKSVTVDIYGRVTGGTNPTTLAGYGITDTYTSAQIDALFGSTASAAASAAAAAVSEANALTYAGNASSSASAAAASESAAASSASAAAASYDAFDDRYLGPKASDPTVDNDGNPLLTGALYWNTVIPEMRVYTGTSWVAAGSSVNGTAERQVYTATSGQTTFAATYDVGYVDVYLNGVKQVSGTDFAASNGTSVVFAVGLTAGDLVDIVAYGAFNLADVYTQAQSDARYLRLSGGTMTGAIAFAAGQTLRKNVSVIGGNTSAVAGTNYVMTASLTLTLPAAPTAGDTVGISNLSGTTTCVIARNGNNIQGLAEDLPVDSVNAAIELMYADATRGWVFI